MALGGLLPAYDAVRPGLHESLGGLCPIDLGLVNSQLLKELSASKVRFRAANISPSGRYKRYLPDDARISTAQKESVAYAIVVR